MKLDVYIEREGSTEHVGSIDTQPSIGEGFTYSDSWLNNNHPFPISLSLPLSKERFPARKVRPYFEGLLPEGRVRASIAQDIHVSTSAYIKILDALGWECIGAVSFKGNDKQPTLAYEPLESSALETIAQQLQAKASWVTEATRFSLAGGQPKVALFKNEHGQWHLPIGMAPSSHILKPTHSKYNDAATNEAICTLAASYLDLNVPAIDIIPTEIPIICTKRFDRVIDKNSPIISGEKAPLRLHQEDLGQALGIVPEHKYEDGGNFDYALRVAELIRFNSSNPIEDLQAFWKALVFNYLIGNCDAHLKNYALIRTPNWSELSLAPLYDLLSTSHYEGLSTELAMSIGRTRKIDKVDTAAFERQAKTMGLPISISMKQLSDMAQNIEAAINFASDNLGRKGIKEAGEIAEKLMLGISKRSSRILKG